MINVAEMLVDAVQKCPDKLAVMDSNTSLTYRQLYSCAKDLSDSIKKHAYSIQKPILVLTSKSVWSIVSFWGVVLSGNFYVPVDENIPQERIKQYISLVNPVMVINASSKEKWQEVDAFNVCKKIKTYNSPPKYEKRIIDSDPLYVVFTSGSTGVPKAVIKSHRSVIAFIESFSAIFEINQKDILGNRASFDFDVSAKDIFLSVYAKATMCIIPSICFLVPSLLAPFLIKNKVTTLIWSAAAVKHVARMNCFRDVTLETISKVFFSGETMQVASIKYWQEHCSSAMYVNMYAPSEVTGNCLYHIVDKEDEQEDNVPLSDTFPNVEVLICKNSKIVKDNEKGEIYIRGAFLANGYYNNAKTTRRVFIQNPLCSTHRDYVYKTGDMAIKRDGKIYFIGRKDNQIKHLGHRIELEEIEKNVFTALGCSEGCALYDKSLEKIVLLLPRMEFKKSELFIALKRCVPKYMIPDEIIIIDKMPYNERGKIDRKKAFMMYMEKNTNE